MRRAKNKEEKYYQANPDAIRFSTVKYDDFGYLKDNVYAYSVKLSGKYFYINDRNEIIKRPKY